MGKDALLGPGLSGFVCITADGDLTIDRWPHGRRNEIFAPPHTGGERNAEVIIATFHTHPNTGGSFFQEPSPGDCEEVRNDHDLKHPEYIGELVVSQDTICWIFPDGQFVAVGATAELLSEE